MRQLSGYDFAVRQDIDSAVRKLEPDAAYHSAWAKWARRWLGRIDSTSDYAKKVSGNNGHFEIIAMAAVIWHEALHCEDQQEREGKYDQIRRLVEMVTA